MWKKRRGQKTHLLVVLRVVQVPTWCRKRTSQSHKFKNKGKFDGKSKFDWKNKPSQSTTFKKKTDKKKGSYHVCGDPGHWAPSCPNRYDRRQHGKGGKTANVVMGDVDMKDVGSEGLSPC
nr:uncharacterized protein LOC127309462 [Lolium perenne]